MGYTHHFAYDPAARSFLDAWPRILADARVIASHVQWVLGIRLAGARGEGQAVIVQRGIALNGPAAGGLAHQPLVIDPLPWLSWPDQIAGGRHALAELERARFRSRGFLSAFCKTARKPYDLAVGAILLRAAHLAPDSFVVCCDGDWEPPLWRAPNPRAAPTPSPGALLAHLFAQRDRPAGHPSLLEVHRGPPCARARSRRRTP